jgi:hypothetical protein
MIPLYQNVKKDFLFIVRSLNLENSKHQKNQITNNTQIPNSNDPNQQKEAI